MTTFSQAQRVLTYAAGDATSADGGDRGAVLLLVAAVFGAGLVFYRVVVPLVRTTVRFLEWVAGVAIKLGLGLMAVGAVAAVVLVLYAMASIGGDPGG